MCCLPSAQSGIRKSVWLRFKAASFSIWLLSVFLYQLKQMAAFWLRWLSPIFHFAFDETSFIGAVDEKGLRERDVIRNNFRSCLRCVGWARVVWKNFLYSFDDSKPVKTRTSDGPGWAKYEAEQVKNANTWSWQYRTNWFWKRFHWTPMRSLVVDDFSIGMEWKSAQNNKLNQTASVVSPMCSPAVESEILTELSSLVFL